MLLIQYNIQKGEFSNSRFLFEQVINISPKDFGSELNMFNLYLSQINNIYILFGRKINRSFQFCHEKKFTDAKEKFTEFASKYPQYQNLVDNNIAYVLAYYF